MRSRTLPHCDFVRPMTTISDRMSDRETAILQEALASLRGNKNAVAPAPAPMPRGAESVVERTIEIPLDERLAAQKISQVTAARAAAARTGPPTASDRSMVFAPAGMDPELASKIALLMEQDADDREERRQRRRKITLSLACAMLVLLFGVLAIAMLSSPPKSAGKFRPTAQPFAIEREAAPHVPAAAEQASPPPTQPQQQPTNP